MSNAAQDPDPGTAVETPAVAAQHTRRLVRGTEPRSDLAETLELVDEMTAMTRSHEHVFGAIERLTGVRHGELQALGAVADGADHPRSVARSTGQTEAAAAATVEGLVARGLLGRHHDARAPRSGEPALVHVSESGTVLIHQAEALRYRLVDAVIDSLDESEAVEFRGAVERATAAFDVRNRVPARAELVAQLVPDAS
ncbi:hypothetical protein [Georgenia subflava]|uniref:MarR family transcriptional regulator n=1 Tax=Georgenia subflava TaxID=1622177 RepID=A0A6N7EMN4_9MICO|nr:hypothetical protein [Georgenia subflava]MPV37406.1 hypothetical protein [Georgenia subflava]